MSVAKRYCVKNPIFLRREDIIKNTFMKIRKALDLISISVNENWILIKFFICAKSERKYNKHSFCDLRRHLIKKIENFEKPGYEISHICEMNITFISDLRNMTYEHYLKQPNQMIEWVLNKEIHKNTKVIKSFRNISHPLIRKNKRMFPSEENQDEINIV